MSLKGLGSGAAQTSEFRYNTTMLRKHPLPPFLAMQRQRQLPAVQLTEVDVREGKGLQRTTTAPTAKGTKSTNKLVGLMAEVMVNASSKRRLKPLYTRESPNTSSLLNQQRPLGEVMKMNRIIRYSSARISAREEARPVGVKL